LQSVFPYDLAASNDGLSLYYRGLAYLEQKNGREAAAQFQTIVDNRAVCWFYWPLAHLGLARAWALTGDTDKSPAMYRRFVELWNGADPDLQILKRAKTEYSQLVAAVVVPRSFGGRAL
jgi:tetratricopeptide (TPR) repeat protein